jgi:hypothetical protein
MARLHGARMVFPDDMYHEHLAVLSAITPNNQRKHPVKLPHVDLHALHARMRWLDSKPATFILGLVVWMNAPAMVPQLWNAITAPPAELASVSVPMFCIFAAIQASVALQAIKTNSTALFWSMTISFVETSIIIALLLIRT